MIDVNKGFKVLFLALSMLIYGCTDYPHSTEFAAPEIERIEASGDGTDAVLTCRLYSDLNDFEEYGFEYWDSTGVVMSVNGSDSSFGTFSCGVSSLESDAKYIFKAFLIFDGRRYESDTSAFTTSPCIIDDNLHDTEFRKKCISLYDLNGDGHLSLSEADKVTCINMTGKISSFKGVEYFRNLDSLMISSCRLDTLDLSSNHRLTTVKAVFSKISKIVLPESSSVKRLELKSNNLEDIDLSACPGLEVLDCSSNGNLKSIDLSEARRLKVLKCGSSAFESMSLDGMEDLEEFLISSSNHSEIGLSATGCKSLRILDVSNLAEPLDFSALPALESLKMASCTYQKVLDLTSNPLVKDVKVSITPLEEVDFSACTAMSQCVVRYTDVKIMDFSRCKAISSIDCRFNSNLSSIIVPAGKEISIEKDNATVVAEAEVI